ncbi:hypothetical protein [Bradyrhizobium jicamae]|nr:hypothetical protein [Bradyrhizobium jicamae]
MLILTSREKQHREIAMQIGGTLQHVSAQRETTPLVRFDHENT